MAKLDFRDDQRLSCNQREQLRAFCGELGGDIVSLANDLGIKVFTEEMMPYESGRLEYAPTCGSESNYKIVINANHAPERQRFSVAHELAHYLLHRNEDDFVTASETRHRTDDYFIYDVGGDQHLEAEANRFAAVLLMPPNLFKPAYYRLHRDLDQLSRIFLVSRSAVENRIRELRL